MGSMSRLSKQNILVTIISVTAIFLIFTLHFHRKSSNQNADTHSKSNVLLNSQLNLRGKDSIPVSESAATKGENRHEIGEFGSPFPSTPSLMVDSALSTVMKHESDNFTSIDSNNLKSNESLIHKTDEQFAIDNLQHDHSSLIDTSAVQQFVTTDAANVSSVSEVIPNIVDGVSESPKAIPSMIPTTLPTTTAMPATVTSQQISPAPTYNPSFEAKSFHGMADSQENFDVIAKLYAHEFKEYSSELKVSPQDILELSPAEIVHNALKKGTIQERESSGSAVSVLKDAVIDAIEFFRPGMAIFYVSEGGITEVAISVAKNLRHLPILLHKFASSAASEGSQRLPIMVENIISKEHSTFSPSALLPKPLHCVQVMEDISILVQEQLPFEFEETISEFLCQCNMTYIPKSLPVSSYFVVWESVEHLISSASERPTAKCSLRLEVGSSSDAGKYATASRFSHLLVMRNTSIVSIEASSLLASNTHLSIAELEKMKLDMCSAIQIAAVYTQYVTRQSVQSSESMTNSSQVLWTGQTFQSAVEFALSESSSERRKPLQRIQYKMGASTEASRQLSVTNASFSELTHSSRRRLYVSSSKYEDKDEIEGNIPNVLWLHHESAGWDDTVLMNMMQRLQSIRKEKAVVSDPFGSNRGRLYLSKKTRSTQSQFFNEENDNYNFWMQLVREGHMQNGKRVVQDLWQVQQMNGTLAIVGRNVGLFSTKLAVMLHLARTNEKSKTMDDKDKSRLDGNAVSSSMIILTVLSQPAVADVLYKLNAVMSVRQNLISAPSKFSPAFFFALTMSQVSIDVSIVEADILYHMLAGILSEKHQQQPLTLTVQDEEDIILGFVQQLTLYLSTSKITYWKLPVSHSLWTRILQLLSVDVQSSLGQHLLRLLTSPDLLFQHVADTVTGRFVVSVDMVQTISPMHVQVYRVEMVPAASSRGKAPHQQYMTPRGLSLHALSWFKLIPAQRKTVFHLLLQLPLWVLRSNDDAASGTSRTDSEIQAIIESISARDIFLRTNQAGDFELVVQNIEHVAASHTIGTTLSPDQSPEITTARGVWKTLQTEFARHPAELAGGRFSFMEYHSGLGLMSTRLAYEYPDATVFSLEKDDGNTDLHLALADAFNVSNDAICHLEMDASTFHRNLYESPELFRFQLFFNNALKQFHETSNLEEWGKHMGAILSSALTTFVYVPNRALVSLGLYSLFGVYCDAMHRFDTIKSNDIQQRQKQVCALTSKSTGIYINAEELLSVYFGQRSAFASKEVSDTSIVLTKMHRLTQLSAHPQRFFINFHSDWLLSTARSKSDGSESSVMFSPMSINQPSQPFSQDFNADRLPAATTYNGALDFPMMRGDIVNMTRHVHHHFDYARDGHSRTYTMHIGINQTATELISNFLQTHTDWKVRDIAMMTHRMDKEGVSLTLSDSTNGQGPMATLALGNHPCQHHITSVRLFRDKDNWPIPYTSIYGVTLITALRMGLKPVLRDRLFKEFLRLPLYEDMAPWNIVLFGKSVDYIDYDTKDVTFDEVLPKAYQIMTVLMNYKRTVEDFKRCGSKASTVYGLPYVSDCVAPTSVANAPKCGSDLRYPVPCGDGQCHSDYISCLRSLARIAEQVNEVERQRNDELQNFQQLLPRESNRLTAREEQYLWAQDLATAMKAVVAKFNASSYQKINYEEFLAGLQ
jgi:hypothetical protein